MLFFLLFPHGTKRERGTVNLANIPINPLLEYETKKGNTRTEFLSSNDFLERFQKKESRS